MRIAEHAHHTAAERPQPAPDNGPRRSWAVLAVALTAQILVVLDISVVNTALPTIGRSLRLDGGDLQWLVTAYLLLSGGGLLLGGRIADLLPRRRVFLAGLTVFTGASLLSGFAGSAAELIAARATQGLGAALMTPAALSIVMTTYSGAQRRKGLALWGAVGSLSVAGGVLLGGALTTWAGWQLIFWINVPIGAVALVVALKVLPKDTTTRADLTQLDLPGALTAIGGLTALMYGLGGTAAHGWLSARTLAALSLSALLLAAFVLVERRVPRPLVPPHTWKIRTLVSGTTVMLGVTGLLVGTVFLTSIFFQTVLGFSALRAGVAFLPLALAITAGAHLAGKMLAHAAPRTIAAAGLALSATGAALLSTASGSAHFAPDLLPGLLIVGLGVGLVFVPVSVTAMTGIPPQHAGLASGFLMTGHEVGAALGVAVLAAVAATAGGLTSPAGVAAGFSRGFVAAAVIAAVLGVVAFVRMPSTLATDGAASGHMH
ncbi:MAG TPA: MFS transporter [Mycobacteriales bacterium]|jgi:EmrB/QacA subfamily drug resistance transporter|nr:MFS transporter [Mycobacteriales bacterium]